MKYKNKILTIIAGGGLVLGACSSDNSLIEEGVVPGPEVTPRSLTFSLALENSEPATRLTNDGNGEISHIGKGEKIDQLTYAVYMVDEATGKYSLDTVNHPVQTISPVDFKDGKRVEFSVSDLMPEKTYHIAFWAQNSGCDAYDTTDLTCVEVKYEVPTGGGLSPNNDENRDAFCQVWTGSLKAIADDNEPVAVTLTRPLAQVNVGTTGADYKNVLEGPDVFPNLKITHSRITVGGVARFLNVVENRILLQEDMAGIGKEKEDAFTDATFGWALIPAFMNLDQVPSDIDGLLKSEGEEYLRVDLNRDGEISDYLTSFPTLGADGSTALTETFKYLSMCYVLAPAGSNGNAVYGNIKVGFAEDENGKNGSNTISLVSANGGRNYRTNILGGLAWVKDPETPEDPEQPDDPQEPELPDDPPASVFTRNFNIMIQTDFQGSVSTDKDQNWSVTWIKNSQD